MSAGFAVGSALIGEIRHDRPTADRIASFRARLEDATDAEVLAAAERLDRPAASQHPLCAEFRAIVDAQLDARGLSLAPLAGGPQ